MKTLTILFVAAIMMGVGCSKNEDSGNNPDKPDKPSPLPDLPDPDDVCSCMDDIIFMQYCYDNFDVNKDGKVSVIEANTARKIDINSECASVKGIERFPNIEILSLDGSSITELDLRYNLKLKILSCQDRQLTTVLLPNTLTAIAFSGCSSLTEINLPASLTSIGEYAFSGCFSLTEINLPDNLTSIGGYAFYDCSSLTEIHLPASLTSIGEYAFSGCSSLTEINLPANLTLIRVGAFYYCSSLTEINLPASLTSIGEYAFSGCSSLTKVTCHALVPPKLNGFSDGTIENLYVPAESIQAYKDSSLWANNFKNILPIE